MGKCLRHQAQSDVSDPSAKAAAESFPSLGTSLFPAAVRSTQAEEMFLYQIVFKFEENAAYLSQRQLT